MYTKKTHGALGVVVIAIALVGALFGAYFAGITGEEHDVVKYNYLADISGLFEYDKSPQYIEFDPSSNYTGYFSSTSGGYWPEGEVGYTPTQSDSQGNPRVNNYRINLAPTSTTTITGDFSSLANENIPGTDKNLQHVLYYISNAYDGGYDRRTADTTSTTIRTLIDTMTDGGNAYSTHGIIKIASENGIGDVSSGTVDDPFDTGWVVFFAYDWVTVAGNNTTALHTINPEYYDTWTWQPGMALKKSPLALSCIIDIGSNSVSLYSNNDYTGLLGVFSIDGVGMAHGTRDDAFTSPSINLSDTATVTLEDYSPAEYLDPSKGVFMEE